MREAGLALREAGHPVCFYADLPSPVPGGPLEFALDLQALVHQLDVSQFERKLTAVGCYATQVAALEQKGVEFQDFDGPELTTVDHIATMGGNTAAWFADRAKAWAPARRAYLAARSQASARIAW